MNKIYNPYKYIDINNILCNILYILFIIIIIIIKKNVFYVKKFMHIFNILNNIFINIKKNWYYIYKSLMIMLKFYISFTHT